jgi:hypothetical protein
VRLIMSLPCVVSLPGIFLTFLCRVRAQGKESLHGSAYFSGSDLSVLAILSGKTELFI